MESYIWPRPWTAQNVQGRTRAGWLGRSCFIEGPFPSTLNEQRSATRTFIAPITLEGEFMLALLVDAPTLILEHSLHTIRLNEKEADKHWRRQRHEDKAQLGEIEKTAKRGRARKA